MVEHKHSVVDELMRLFKVYRIDQGLTLEDLADRAGIHRTHIGLLERGERAPSLDVANDVAKALGYELSDILRQAELIVSGKVDEKETIAEEHARIVRHGCLRNSDKLQEFTGLTSEMLMQAIHGCYHILDTIDRELVGRGAPPIGKLVELANLSSMVGNMIGGVLADSSEGLYVRNKPHHYPDLLPQGPGAKELELKMALETNRPKGHLPKPGNYITVRYVLGDNLGNYSRGKDSRGDTVWIWEVKVGRINKEDFDCSDTEGDSGKTAVVQSKVFNAMSLVYYDEDFCPYARRKGAAYPGFN